MLGPRPTGPAPTQWKGLSISGRNSRDSVTSARSVTNSKVADFLIKQAVIINSQVHTIIALIYLLGD